MGYDHGPDERSIYVGMYYQKKERYENWEAFKNDYNSQYPNNKPLTDSYSDKFKFCGHYMLLSDPDYKSVGISKNSTYGETVIDLNPELINMNDEKIQKTYSVAEWTERFNTYYNKMHGDLTVAQEKLDDATAAKKAAEGKHSRSKFEKDAAGEALEAAHQAEAEKQETYDTAKSNADRKREAAKTASEALSAAENASNALDHPWDTGVITADAACTEEGVKVYTCGNCGDTVKEYLPALGHDFSEEWTVDEEPTFTEEGSESRHCTRCDEVTDVKAIPVLTFTDVDEATPHTDEVMWLAKTGVSKDWTEIDGTRTFRPYVDVARCDMAAFLRRLVG